MGNSKSKSKQEKPEDEETFDSYPKLVRSQEKIKLLKNIIGEIFSLRSDKIPIFIEIPLGLLYTEKCFFCELTERVMHEQNGIKNRSLGVVVHETSRKYKFYIVPGYELNKDDCRRWRTFFPILSVDESNNFLNTDEFLSVFLGEIGKTKIKIFFIDSNFHIDDTYKLVPNPNLTENIKGVDYPIEVKEAFRNKLYDLGLYIKYENFPDQFENLYNHFPEEKLRINKLKKLVDQLYQAI